MAVKYKLQINSVTVLDSDSSEKLIITFQFDDDIENEIGEVIILAPQTINDTVAASVGQTLEIWRGFTTSTDKKIFSGRIAEIKPQGGTIEIVARNKLWNLVKQNVNKVYDVSESQAGVISAIAKDLIETHGGMTATIVNTGTGEGKIINQFKCINTDIWERLQALKKAVNYQIRFDVDTDIVHFEPRGFNETGKTLTVGTEILQVPNWDYDSSKLVNSLRVDGATILTNLRLPLSGGGEIGTTSGFATTGITLPDTPEIVELFIDAADPPTTIREGGSKDGATGNFYYVDKENKKVIPVDGSTFTSGHFAIVNYTWAAPVPILMENETSIEDLGGRPDGVFEKQMTFPDISSIEDAESRAVEILARFSTPLVSASIMLRNTAALDLKVGDLITVVDTISKPNVNRTFVITRRKINFPGDVEELEIGDALLRIQDWQMMTEERIKRLEEELLRNQDLIVVLKQMKLTDKTTHNAKRNYVRYSIAQTQAYTVADNTLIWDHPVHGIWDTDNWATLANPDGFDDAADVFVQNFDLGTANKYVEDFIDADFKDSTSTATWGTTGSVNFTSGQIAQTSAVDKNNGTITVATLTATEVSGSFDYELTADYLIPIAQWKCNDNTASTVVTDDGTLGHNLVAIANTDTMTASGKINNSFTFDGTDVEFVEGDDETSTIYHSGDHTYMCWVKMDKTDTSQYLFDHYNWRFTTTSGSKFRATIGRMNDNVGPAYSINADNSFSTGVWYHLAMVYDPTNQEFKFYVDGVQQGSTTDIGTDIIYTSYGSTENRHLRFGNSAHGNAIGMEGDIDDARIYNSALNLTEIQAVYNSGNGTEESNANWETVTSGVAYTFTNTGTDLRFKITENATSTGEISKVIISGYH